MDSGGDRIHVLDAIGRQFEELETREAPRRPSRRRPRALVAALTAAVALTVLSLTPMGQAVADRLGELIGIGDEPSGSVGFGTPAVVIGVGESPDGVAYEVVASRQSDDPPGARETCIGLDLPRLSGIRVAQCIVGETASELQRLIVSPIVYAAPDELGPGSELVVQGLARGDVAEVAIKYPSKRGERRAPVQLAYLDHTVADLIDASERAGVFVGFVPDGVLSGSERQPKKLTHDSIESSLARITISARDGEGRVLITGDAWELLRAREALDASPLLADPPDGFRSNELRRAMRPPPNSGPVRPRSGG
jgi:hypothetical protein